MLTTSSWSCAYTSRVLNKKMERGGGDLPFTKTTITTTQDYDYGPDPLKKYQKMRRHSSTVALVECRLFSFFQTDGRFHFLPKSFSEVAGDFSLFDCLKLFCFEQPRADSEMESRQRSKCQANKVSKNHFIPCHDDDDKSHVIQCHLSSSRFIIFPKSLFLFFFLLLACREISRRAADTSTGKSPD